MWSYTEELQKLLERYPRCLEMHQVFTRKDGYYKEFSHVDHTDYMRELEELLKRDAWIQEAKRQLFVAEVKAEIKAAKPSEYKQKLVALTICPDSGDHNTMQSIMEVVKSCSCAKCGGKYVIEQRSKGDEEPYGWHLHMVVKTTYAPTKVKQFVQQKLASRGYVATYYATAADARWESKYMSGVKGHAEKDLKVAKDRVLRAKYGIPDMEEW